MNKLVPVLLVLVVLFCQVSSCQLLEKFLRRAPQPTIEGSNLKTRTEYILWVYIPGVLPSNIRLDFYDSYLNVAVVLKSEAAAVIADRTFSLPRLLDLSKASSSWKEEVLEIRIPLKQPGNIPIAVLEEPKINTKPNTDSAVAKVAELPENVSPIAEEQEVAESEVQSEKVSVSALLGKATENLQENVSRLVFKVGKLFQ